MVTTICLILFSLVGCYVIYTLLRAQRGGGQKTLAARMEIMPTPWLLQVLCVVLGDLGDPLQRILFPNLFSWWSVASISTVVNQQRGPFVKVWTRSDQPTFIIGR